ncbi:hypothetical protein K431DRAFT_232641 [Polychaeton citri CBS 116435]|uniref:Thioesterase/thiol ester dehydrase-isomerase n=1 Tax=Polychaeton citri CBS 116435 TaxID=1314669 RepID=A0A9P4PZ51_9PEZI|nr:hypothetical protein K431DRAFT_232641 [Polychaeton citri CBS 116435]
MKASAAQCRRLLEFQVSSTVPVTTPCASLRSFHTTASQQRSSNLETSAPSSSSPADQLAPVNPRWLSDVKQRIGKCIMFGLRPKQVLAAGSILSEITRDWRDLVVGSEGFLTSPDRRGLYRQRVVWGEMDSMGHVNNVTYNRYAESGRVEWALKYAEYIDPIHAQAWTELVSPKSEGLILRRITTDFKFPMKWPDRVTVYHKLTSAPTPSTEALLLDVVILSEKHQRPAARVAEDCAIYDYVQGRKVKMHPFMLKAFKETWRLQEEAKRANTQRVRNILQRVRQLELESWDREGAVEDLGSHA